MRRVREIVGLPVLDIESGDSIGWVQDLVLDNDKDEVVGACGTNDFCVNGYESCYLCHKFRPLLDGPHELVLESLYKQKKQRLQESKSIEYASAKDRVILAVEQVVAECKRIKSERGQVNG